MSRILVWGLVFAAAVLGGYSMGAGLSDFSWPTIAIGVALCGAGLAAGASQARVQRSTAR